jgi:phosphoserine phosphatase RsbU/P
MLAEVVASYYSNITSLAESWLEAGATSFAIWKNERLLGQWPPEHSAQQPSIIVPIYAGETVVGDLRVTGVSGREMRARLAAEAAIVADLVRQEQDLQIITAALVERQDQMLAIYELAQSLRGHVTIEDTLRCLAFEAKRLLRADHVFTVFLGGSLQPILIQSPDGGLSEQAIWEVFWETHIGERSRILDDDDARLKLLPGVESLMIVPLRQRDGMNGLLGIARRSGQFVASEMKLTQAIVTLAGTQLDNILLYREAVTQARLQAEMELARRVQISLLPQQLPVVPGLELFAVARPALQVGGDFYDMICRPNHPLVFAIGDIAGKGLSSALLMTMTRTAIHSKASFMPEPNPAAIMRHSNEDLYEDFARVGVFATVLIGQYQPQDSQLVYANAGHVPIIYRPAGEAPRLLLPDSPAMGVLMASVGGNHTIRLGPGDLLVAATDGLIDARNPRGEFFGNERLMQLVDELAEQPAAEIAHALLDAITCFEDGRSQDDDQTLVILKGVAQ